MERTKFVIPAKLLVVVTGLLSTAASLGGGLLLYYEGLSLLEHTVEDAGRADVSSVSAILKSGLELPEMLGTSLTTFMQYQTVVPGAHELLAHFPDVTMHTVVASGVYGVMLMAYSPHNTTTNPKGYQAGVWFDVMKNGERQYISAQYNPSFYNISGCKGHCIVCHNMDEKTFRVTGEAYNYTSSVKDIAPGGHWRSVSMAAGSTQSLDFWRGPYVWYSGDGTPGLYLAYQQTVPFTSIPEFDGSLVYSISYLLISTWLDVLDQLTTSARMIVVSQKGNVLGSNFGVKVSQEGSCSNSDTERSKCLVEVEDLDPTTAENVYTLNRTAPGTFLRERDFWLLRRLLYTPGDRDLLPEISLMWMRSISSVEDKLNDALFYLILFVLLVLVLDIAIGAAEVLLFARPLRTMVLSSQQLQVMDLEGMKATLSTVVGCVSVAEVGVLAGALGFAAHALHEYKAFIPHSVLEESLSESQAATEKRRLTVSGASSRPPSPKSSRTSVSNSQPKSRLLLQVENAMAVVAVIHLPGHEDADYPERYTALLQAIQKERGDRAVHRMMGEYIFLVWSGQRVGTLPVAATELCTTLRCAFHKLVAGVAMGKCRLGNMGTSTLRAVNILGTPPCRAHSLCMLNPTMHTGVLADGAVAKALSQNPAFTVRPVDRVSFSNEAVPETLSEVIGVVVEEENAEWMYTLEKAETRDNPYFDAWKAATTHSLDKGIKLLDKIPRDAVLDAVLARLQAAKDAGHDTLPVATMGYFVPSLLVVPANGL